MLKKIISRLLRRRHFWRDIGFDELSEIYVSMMLRNLALSLIGIFVPIYLYRLGYPLTAIAVFYLCFFMTKICVDGICGKIVGRIGPKHAIASGYLFVIASSSLFLTIEQYRWPLIMPAVLWAIGNSLFFISLHVDFSKVKHSAHGGKELGYLSIMEKIGGALGPLVGGLVATLIGPQHLFLIAIIILLLGLVPLFSSGEPVRTRQYVVYARFPWSRARRDIISHMFLNAESTINLGAWPLFLGIYVFGEHVYAGLGLLTSVSLVLAMMTARAIGQIVDHRRGGELLRYATYGKALLYVSRFFITVAPTAYIVNIVNEMLTVGYQLPYHKGMYDAADHYPGQRIAYITLMELTGDIAKLAIWVILYTFALHLPDRQVFYFMFGIAAFAAIGVNTQRFKALTVKVPRHA